MTSVPPVEEPARMTIPNEMPMMPPPNNAASMGFSVHARMRTAASTGRNRLSTIPPPVAPPVIMSRGIIKAATATAIMQFPHTIAPLVPKSLRRRFLSSLITLSLLLQDGYFIQFIAAHVNLCSGTNDAERPGLCYMVKGLLSNDFE